MHNVFTTFSSQMDSGNSPFANLVLRGQVLFWTSVGIDVKRGWIIISEPSLCK